MSGDFTKKESKAVEKLMGELSDKFGISADQIEVGVRRNVLGHEGEVDRRRDYLDISISNGDKTVKDSDGNDMFSVPVQNFLAERLSEHWGKNKKGIPLVYVDIPLPNAPSKASQCELRRAELKKTHGAALNGGEGNAPLAEVS